MVGRRRWTLTLIGVIILLLAFVFINLKTLNDVWEDFEPDLRFRTLLNMKDTSGHTGKRKILFWNSIFGDNWFLMGKSGHFDHCPRYNNCFATRYRGLVSVDEFDAILFHGNELSRYDIPQRRDPRQRYLFVNLESPVNRPLTDTFFEVFFNLTLTYRLDSDIVWPYQVLRDIETRKIVAPLQDVEWAEPPGAGPAEWKPADLLVYRKTKMAAWLVSNCATPSKRELYVEELRKHMQVDVIGYCAESGSPKCPISRACFTEVIEPEYFFYLSFENSLCKDYVTEKFFKALSHNVIPVVYGGANYSLFAPPHSYVDALDFESPKALADFLIKLSQDQEEYSKYFWWKRIYTVSYTGTETLCYLCELLNQPKPSWTYSPLSSWWTMDKCPIQDSLRGMKFATKESRSYRNEEK